MWTHVYIWIYTHMHIYLMKPWTPLWKNVRDNIFSFIRLSFSILIIQVPLGMVKISTYDFTLQLASVSMLDQTRSFLAPHSLVLRWWVGPTASASLCAKIGKVSGIPEGPPEHYRWSFWGRMGRPDEFKSRAPSLPSTHPVQHSRSSHCIFLIISLLFSFVSLPI